MAIRDIYFLQRSEAFRLDPGKEKSVDLSLKKVPKTPRTLLKGHVFTCKAPIAGATVKVFNKGFEPIAHTATDQWGGYAFANQLVPGEYKIMATAEGYGVSADYSVSLKPFEPVTAFFRLRPSVYSGMGTVYGVVYDQANKVLPDVKVVVKDYGHPHIKKAVTRTNFDGEYLVYGLYPQKYWISAGLKDYTLPQDIAVNVLPDEETHMDLFLYKSALASDGTVSGKIEHNGMPVPNAVAALYKVEGDSHTLVAFKRTNESGVYLFTDLKPGEYIVKSKAVITDIP